MIHSRFPRRKAPSYERTGLVASLIAHVVLAWILLSSKAPVPPQTNAIEVTIEPPSRQTQRQQPQIVSPSEKSPTSPPEDTSRLSDVDSRTEIERIRRGDGGGITGSSQNTRSASGKQSNPSKAEAAQPKTPPRQDVKTNNTQETQSTKQPKSPAPQKDLNLKDLTLDKSTLAMKFGNKAAQSNQVQRNQAPNQPLSEYQAFSRPPGSGAAFLGTAGISDHLPNLPDGDITLLNAQANIYASFVRRVAVQVFTQLRSQGWEKLSAQQIRQLQGFSTIEAVLAPDGSFIKAQLIESSGSNAFDSVLSLAVQGGARDPNPPQGALAKDGLIHFIFKARSWSQMGVNRRTGAPTENRWLLLATGLE